MKKKIFVLIYFFILSSALLNAQEKKAGKIIAEYFTALDAGDHKGLSMLLTDDIQVSAPMSSTVMNKSTWLSICKSFKQAFPDMMHQSTSWFADDNMVAERGIFSGTNTGPMMGNPPTKNKVTLSYTSVFELNGKGKIKSINIQFDNKSLESQLMAGIPSSGKMLEKTIRELFALMDAGEADKIVNYCSADFTISNPFLSAPSPIGAFQGILQTQKTAFPDMKHEIIEMTSDDRHVTTRGVFTGTNTGSMMGNPPTGNKVKIPFIVLDEFDVKGKLKFRNVQFDAKSFENQLMAGINPNGVYETNIRAMYAAADNGDTDKFLSYWSDHSHPYFLGVENTRDEVKQRILAFKKSFPDVKRSIEEIQFSGNKVIIRGVLTGTNKGSFMGKPATNNSIKVTWIGLYHFKQDGKIENGWVEYDTATMQNQITKKPMPKKGSK